MSRNREVSRTNQQSNAELDRLNREYGDYTRSRNQYAGEARGRSDQVFNEAMQRYRDFSSGLGRGDRGNNEALSHYRDFARGGGVSNENIERMRGKGVFDEFAKTGGLSEDDKSLYRARGTATVPSFYENLRNEMGRQAAVQGGRNVGFDAQMALSSREQAKAAQEAATSAEADILDRVTSGRQWGASSLSDAEKSVVDALQRGKMFGVEGLQHDFDTGREDSYRNRALDLQAIEGMRGLRTDTPGEVSMYEQGLLEALGGGSGARRGVIQDRMSYNPNQSFMERAAPYISAATGIASAFVPGGQAGMAAGLGGFLSRRNRGNTGVRGPMQMPQNVHQRYGVLG